MSVFMVTRKEFEEKRNEIPYGSVVTIIDEVKLIPIAGASVKEESKPVYIKTKPYKCECCGAPLKYNICSYCGTRYV